MHMQIIRILYRGRVSVPSSTVYPGANSLHFNGRQFMRGGYNQKDSLSVTLCGGLYAQEKRYPQGFKTGECAYGQTGEYLDYRFRLGGAYAE